VDDWNKIQDINIYVQNSITLNIYGSDILCELGSEHVNVSSCKIRSVGTILFLTEFQFYTKKNRRFINGSKDLKEFLCDMHISSHFLKEPATSFCWKSLISKINFPEFA
jgi:hypothetical protein